MHYARKKKLIFFKTITFFVCVTIYLIFFFQFSFRNRRPIKEINSNKNSKFKKKIR